MSYPKQKRVLVQVLLDVDGDVDAAIEFLVAEQGTEEPSVRADSPSNCTDNSPCNGQYVSFFFSFFSRFRFSHFFCQQNKLQKIRNHLGYFAVYLHTGHLCSWPINIRDIFLSTSFRFINLQLRRQRNIRARNGGSGEDLQRGCY